MNRRTALTLIGALATTTSGWSQSINPYSPGNATDYRVLDLASVREVIVRLPKGNITVTTEEIWQALQKKP